MPFYLHCIVKDAADADQVGAGKMEKHKMPGAANDAAFMPRPLPAMAQMVAAHIVAEFGPRDTSDTVGLTGKIAQRGHKQILVPQPCHFAEAFMGLRQDLDNVGLRCIGQADIVMRRFYPPALWLPAPARR